MARLSNLYDQKLYKMSMKEHLSSLALHRSTVSVAYPNLSKVAQVFLALPVGTADCERESRHD